MITTMAIVELYLTLSLVQRMVNRNINHINLVKNYLQGFQHFMKKKFPDISLRKFQHSMRNTFPLMRLLGSQEVVLAQLTVTVWRSV